MATLYERIASSVPVDGNAVRITFRSKEAAASSRLCGSWTREVIPLGSPVGPKAEDLARELAGRRFGRLTIVGYGRTARNGAKWVVRCSCGSQGEKTLSQLRDMAAKNSAMCPDCTWLEQKKTGDTSAPWAFGPGATVPVPGNYPGDLTGRRFGAVRVEGYLGKGRWLARCDCGRAGPQTKKALELSAAGAIHCSACHD